MKISLLDIKGFGKLKKLIIRPDEGFNIIYEDNEAGKSTLQAFIKAMFYGLKSGRKSRDGTLPPLKHYQPWNGDQYAGVMEYTLSDNSVFRVGRNFEKGTVNIYDGNANNVTNEFPHAKDVGPKFAEEHLGLDEETFSSSVFIGQMQCEIGSDGRKTLIEKLSNLTTTGSEELSLTRAVKCLETELLERVGTDRSSVRPLNIVNNRLRELEQEKEELAGLNEKYLDTAFEYQEKRSLLVRLEGDLKEKKELRERAKLNRLAGLRNEYNALINKTEELNVEIEKYTGTIEKHRSFANIDEETVSKAQLFLHDKNRAEEEILSLGEEARNIRDKIQKTEEVLDSEEAFKQKTVSVEEALRERSFQQEDAKHRSGLNKNHQKYKRIGTVGAVLAAIFLVLSVLSPVFLGAVLIFGVISFLFLRNSSKYKVKEETKVDRLPQVLSDNGFDDLNDYLSYKEDQIKYRSELEFLRQELIENQERINKLKENLENINHELSTIIEKAGVSGQDHREAVEKIVKGLETFKNARQQKIMLLSEKEGIEDKCKACLREAATILGKHLNSVEELDKITEDYINKYGQIQEEIDEATLDEEIKLMVERIKNVELQIASLEAKLEDAPGEGELASVMEEIEICKERKRSLEKLGDSLSLAIDILNETALKLQRDFTPALNNEMSRYMSQLSSDKYQRVLANDKLQINLEVPETDELILVNRLSGGTVDQVYFSMRMAAVNLMEKGREKLPIFLDEPFSQYDEKRVRQAFELLKKISEDRQVFFFTCRKREFELASEVFGDKMNRIRLSGEN